MFLEAQYVDIGVRESFRLYWPTSLATPWRMLSSVFHWYTWLFILVRQTNARTTILLESLGIAVCSAPFSGYFMAFFSLWPPFVSCHITSLSSLVLSWPLIVSPCLSSLHSYLWVLSPLCALFSNPMISPRQCPRTGTNMGFLFGLLSSSPIKWEKSAEKFRRAFQARRPSLN